MCEIARRIHELLPFYAGDTLPDAERALIETHIESCGECREALQEWQQIRGAVCADLARRARPLPPIDPLIAMIAPTLVGRARSSEPMMRRNGHERAPVAGRRGGQRWKRLLGGFFGMLLVALLVAVVGGRGVADHRVSIEAAAGPGSREEVGSVRDGRSGAPNATAVARRPTVVSREFAALRPSATATTQPASVLVVVVALPTATAEPVVPTEAPKVTVLRAALRPPAAASPEPADETTTTREDRQSEPYTPGLLEPGRITGRVTGPDGAGRAEVQVIASPLEASSTPVSAYTAVSGAYELDVPPGQWFVHVETLAYQSQWFRGKPSPFEADTIGVTGGDQIGSVEFVLEAHPAGRAMGRVTTVDGKPVHRGLVVGVPWDGGSGAGQTVVAFTNAEGLYRLYLRPGTYMLGATVDWRSWPTTWWDGHQSPDEPNAAEIVAGGEIHHADFVLVGAVSP